MKKELIACFLVLFIALAFLDLIYLDQEIRYLENIGISSFCSLIYALTIVKDK